MVMSNYMSNPVLALMNNDSEDAFVRDVAEAYFSNPAHVRRILNEDCIESCVQYVLDNQRVEFDLSDLALFNEDEPFFTKPSRQKGRRKHNKKAVRRKGSAKRFRDRSRKWASEGHMCKTYNRGLTGDWGRRGRRLAETGEVAFKTNQRLVRDITVDPEVQDEEETRTFTYEDGFTLSMSMSKSTWETEPEDDFSPSFNWDRMEQREKCVPDWCYDEYRIDWNGFDYDEEEDEVVVTEADDYMFSAIEMADMSMKMATATAEQRTKIREFFKSL